MILKFFLKLSS